MLLSCLEIKWFLGQAKTNTTQNNIYTWCYLQTSHLIALPRTFVESFKIYKYYEQLFL